MSAEPFHERRQRHNLHVGSRHRARRSFALTMQHRNVTGGIGMVVVDAFFAAAVLRLLDHA